jgi:hypothetical protein
VARLSLLLLSWSCWVSAIGPPLKLRFQSFKVAEFQRLAEIDCKHGN